MLLDKKAKIIISVERVANDFKKGFPVIIVEDGVRILALSPETASTAIIENLMKDLPKTKASLVISSKRANFTASKNTEGSLAISISKSEIKKIPILSGVTGEILSKKLNNTEGANHIQSNAVRLAKIAELIPSAITFAISSDFHNHNFLEIDSKNIEQYADAISYSLNESCRTKISLKNAVDSEIVAYRPNLGSKEHYAIIIGKKLAKTPLVRVHSSCYTGDLLDSLACDCHDQLHTAIEIMAKNDGGIVLYMLQEGRGIGLINKLRTYALKEQGLDTVDANEALGFDDDERIFLPAAEILKRLKIKKIKLLTNNPKKASGLKEYGISVAECVPHIMPSNEHNKKYLKTKSKRLGHKM